MAPQPDGPSLSSPPLSSTCLTAYLPSQGEPALSSAVSGDLPLDPKLQGHGDRVVGPSVWIWLSTNAQQGISLEAPGQLIT